jgi:hypothetical protein
MLVAVCSVEGRAIERENRAVLGSICEKCFTDFAYFRRRVVRNQ